MPFLLGLGQIVGNFVFKRGKLILYWSALAALIAFVVVGVGVMINLLLSGYIVIKNQLNTFTYNPSGLFGCIINSLGLDIYFTSVLAVFTTALIFASLGVSYILVFKFTIFVKRTATIGFKV